MKGAAFVIALLAACLQQASPPAKVSATVETDPVPNDGDAADDPAIWVHPDDPSRSTVIGTDKQGGLAVYALDGKEIQYLKGAVNNVDLRYGFRLGGKSVDLVTATDVRNGRIAVYRVDPSTGKLEPAAGREIRPSVPIYGSCMYRSAKSGRYFAIVASYSGDVEWWELFDDGRGKVEGRRVRAEKFPSTVEGCVADDELGFLYVGEESAGIWKFGAEPDDRARPVLVDRTGEGGRLTADVEGLALYCAPGGTGYLLASSQGNDSFVAYRREGKNEYVMTFKIEAGGGVDGVGDTDGIEVVSTGLGERFPKGLFVAQDGDNDRGNQNFKLVPWERIAGAGERPLKVEPGWNPRKVR